MFYVYILQSVNCSERFYVGLTTDLTKRLEEHNAGKSMHTNKFKPWLIKTYIAIDDRLRAESFEKYLKTSSGRAFSKKRF